MQKFCFKKVVYEKMYVRVLVLDEKKKKIIRTVTFLRQKVKEKMENSEIIITL